MIRLGDGTEESHERMIQALELLWPYTGELFIPAPYETALGIDLASLRSNWNQKINAVLEEATLTVPGPVYMQQGGKTGLHSEHLGFLLTDLQYMQRTYPGAEW